MKNILKNTSKTLKWAIFILFSVKTALTIYSFFSLEILTSDFSVISILGCLMGVIFSNSRTVALILVYLSIFIAILLLTGLILLLAFKRKTLPPAIILSLVQLADIIFLCHSLTSGIDIAATILAIAFNLALLAIIILYAINPRKETRYETT